LNNRGQKYIKLPTDPTNTTTFVTRIYFANYTHISISIPVTETVSYVLKAVLEKLNIKDHFEDYALFEVKRSEGTDKLLSYQTRVYDTILAWTSDEYLAFRRKSSRNNLRARSSQDENSIHSNVGQGSSDLHHQLILQGNNNIPHSNSSRSLSNASSESKRITKLAGFFGVESSLNTFLSPQESSNSELKTMLNLINSDASDMIHPINRFSRIPRKVFSFFSFFLSFFFTFTFSSFLLS